MSKQLLDALRVPIEKGSFVNPCSPLGILQVSHLYEVCSINDNCFHIEIIKKQKSGKSEIFEACINNELSIMFRVNEPDSIDLNLDKILK